MPEIIDAGARKGVHLFPRYQPLVPVALAVVAGILVGEYVGGTAAIWCVAAIVAGGAWLALRLSIGGCHWLLVSQCRPPDVLADKPPVPPILRGKPWACRDRWLLAALLAMVLATAAAWYHVDTDPPPDDVARLAAVAPRVVQIEGIVVRSPRQSSPPGDVFLPAVAFYTRSSMAIDCERVCVDDTWYTASGRVQTIVRQPQPEDGPPVRLGDRVRVVGVLMTGGRPANPGSFDVADYLRTQGIRAHLSTDEWTAVRVVQPGADRLRALVGVLQRWAVGRLAAVPTPEGRGVAAAMLFGRRDMLDFDTGQTDGEDLQHAFLATGTVHYMAVSGFNVAMVVAPILVLLRLLGTGRRLTAVIVAAVVLAFVLMTELEPPVIRAAILFWVVCIGWLWCREPTPANTLAAAVIGVLVLRPGDLFSMSFQLSFLAVLGMMLVVGRMEEDLLGRLLTMERLRGRPGGGFWIGRVLRGMLLVSVAATLMTAPLIAHRIHIFAWTSPIASTILLPEVLVLTVFGMVQVSLGWISPGLDAALAVPLDVTGRLVAATVKGLAHIPGSYTYVGQVSPLWVLAAYAVVALWVWRDRLWWPRRRVAAVALALAAAFVWTTGHRAPADVRATFLAVGNGNTTLLELPGGRTLLYDAGSSVANVRAAESTIAPALWSRGVGHVDAILISHPHFDHFKDILPLVERFGVRQVFVPPTFMRDRLSVDGALVQALQARGVAVTCLGAGDRLAGTGPAEVRAIWPRGPPSQTKALNDGSLVVAVDYGGRRLLLTGDLMPAGMAALAAAEPSLRADAMLWPHHGHDPAAVGDFVARTGARVLVVSAARPRISEVEPPWLKGQGAAACYRTGESGAITLDLGPAGLRVATFLGGAATVELDPEPAPRVASDD
jgi:competence protein ComEC